MTDAPAGLAADLQHYLQQGRDNLLRALDGLSEYDVRRPLVPSGTSLLGLVKHVASCEAGYLLDCPGRPGPTLPWNEDGSVWDGADMWATAEESRDDLVGLYRQIWALSDAAIAELPLDTDVEVAWWPAERRRTTFGRLLARMIAETAQHAGHADILRETIDGRGGRDAGEYGDAAYWETYVGRIQAAADQHR